MRCALGAEALAKAAVGALVLTIAGATVSAQEVTASRARRIRPCAEAGGPAVRQSTDPFRVSEEGLGDRARPTTAVIPGATAPIVSVVQRKREAAVVVEQTKLHQPLALDDITDLFSQLEADSIRERQPQATDVRARLVDVGGGRRLVILTYGRPGVGGGQRVRQYSIPAGADLFRLTCIAPAGQFARYEAVFAHVAASFAVASGGTQ